MNIAERERTWITSTSSVRTSMMGKIRARATLALASPPYCRPFDVIPRGQRRDDRFERGFNLCGYLRRLHPSSISL